LSDVDLYLTWRIIINGIYEGSTNTGQTKNKHPRIYSHNAPDLPSRSRTANRNDLLTTIKSRGAMFG